MAEACFQKGNAAFVDEDFETSLQHYNDAIDQDDTNTEYYVKRATVHLKLYNHTDALADAASAIQIDSTCARAYLRQGQAYFGVGDLQKAKESLTQAETCGETHKICKELLDQCHEKLGTTRQEDAAKVSQTAAQKPNVVNESSVAAAPLKNSSKDDRIQHQWYQNSDFVIVSIMIKKLKEEDVSVTFTDKALSVDIKLSNGTDYNLEIDTFYKYNPASSKYKVMSTKVEVKLKKFMQVQWPGLEGEGLDGSTGTSVAMAAGGGALARPPGYEAEQKWSRLAKEAEQQEKDEKVEGDAALNKLFQDIYKDADEDTRRAMNKSFQESNGTVLSTNWKDIKKETTPIKPPDGMEVKKW